MEDYYCKEPTKICSASTTIKALSVKPHLKTNFSLNYFSFLLMLH